MLKWTALWIAEQVKHVSKYSPQCYGVLVCKLMGCDDIYNWNYGLHVDDLGLSNLCILFIVLVQKSKRKRVPDGSLEQYVKLVFCLVFFILE